jgi:hypothetical protein
MMAAEQYALIFPISRAVGPCSSLQRKRVEIEMLGIVRRSQVNHLRPWSDGLTLSSNKTDFRIQMN